MNLASYIVLFICNCDRFANIYLCVSNVNFLNSLLIFWVIDFNCWTNSLSYTRHQFLVMFSFVFFYEEGGGRGWISHTKHKQKFFLFHKHSDTLHEHGFNFQVNSNCGKISWPLELFLHHTWILEVSSLSLYCQLQLVPCLSAK